VAGSRREQVIGREVALDLSRELSDTRLSPGKSATLMYRVKVESAGMRARVAVVVEPDAFYAAFFETLLRQGAGRGEAQIREALEAARRLDRGLRVEPSVDEARDERRLRLRLALAAHRAVDEARAAVHEVHGRDQGVRGLLARRQSVHVSGVDGEERAPVLEEDAGVSRDHARAELPVEA